MACLIDTDPFEGLLPLAAGDCALAAAPPGPVFSIAPFAGQEAAVSAALAPLGLAFPAPGRMLEGPAARILAAGRALAFLAGAAPPDLAGRAAVTDQSDAWAVMALAGPAHLEVLARLLPLDLRPAAFPPGATARSALVHCPALVARRGPDAVELWVMRSMAGTALHEIEAAMRAVAARTAAG